MCSVHLPPIDAIRFVFTEEIGRAGGAVGAVYDVGGLLYARAMLPGLSETGGALTAGVALRVTDDVAEVRPAVTWGDARALLEMPVEVTATVDSIRGGTRACVVPAIFDEAAAEQRSAAGRGIEHPGNVVLSLITALARTGDASERLLPLLPAIMDRVRAGARPTDWTAVEAVASVALTAKDETTRWHLDVLAGRLLMLRPSAGRQAWAAS